MRKYNTPESSVIVVEPKNVICQSFDVTDFTETLDIEDVELI